MEPLLVHRGANAVGVDLVGPRPGTLFHRHDVVLGPCPRKISFYSSDVKPVVCSARVLSRQTPRAELPADGTGDGDWMGSCIPSIDAAVVYAGVPVMLVNDFDRRSHLVVIAGA